MSMLNRKERLENKSKGPWGMKSFEFSYRKMGETLHRSRFLSAPSEEGAIQQFNAMMSKSNIQVEILEILEEE
jgi:hypothetical protein